MPYYLGFGNVPNSPPPHTLPAVCVQLGRLLRTPSHRTTGAIGPILRGGDAGFPPSAPPHINPNSLTDRARLVCYAPLHA